MQIIDANFLITDYQLLICLVTNYPLLKFGCWLYKSAMDIPLLISNGYCVTDPLLNSNGNFVADPLLICPITIF